MADVLASSNTGLVNRMARAARLDKRLYDEVDADQSATAQALLVVVVAAVAAGVGGAIGAALQGASSAAVTGIIGGIIAAIFGWVIWSLVMYIVGSAVFHAPITYSRVLRSIGFADTPGVLLIFSFIPFLGGVIRILVFLWQIAASFIAVREGLELDNTQTIVTIILGFIGLLIALAIVSIPLTLLGLAAGGLGIGGGGGMPTLGA